MLGLSALKINVRGARENNLKDVDLVIGDGLTVVTGVSGSGKSSLVFDTVYHEARRRFQEVFAFGSPNARVQPAQVDSITGLGPAVAVGQNLLNRNPGSSLATASGLHPFLRILYSRFGVRHCAECGEGLQVSTEDEIVDRLTGIVKDGSTVIFAPLVKGLHGSHGTLLRMLSDEFGSDAIFVDGNKWGKRPLETSKPHDISVKLGALEADTSTGVIRDILRKVFALGSTVVLAETDEDSYTFSSAQVCPSCGTWFHDLEPTRFNQKCPHCNGDGCPDCNGSGMWPEASATTVQGLRLSELLSLSVDDAERVIRMKQIPHSADRLMAEIAKRLAALKTVGLGYVSLDRSSPSLSRGESQRVRLAVALTSRLEDILHVLDEPTIGQHPYDVERLLPSFRRLAGPVLYVEHDRVAAAHADHALDIGPGAGVDGGRIVFTGTPSQLWKSETDTGRFFSLRDRVRTPEGRGAPGRFIEVKGAIEHNLKDIDVKIPQGKLTVITGVSGSGKSTLVENVLVASLNAREPVGCSELKGGWPRAVMVDQSPIGKNPRSTPSTYTKLSDVVRDLYARKTGLSASHFSFNRPEGACPNCKGMGAVEIKMRYLPSVWIQCADCGGQRFNDEVLGVKVRFGDVELSIAEFNELSITEANEMLKLVETDSTELVNARRILKALKDIGLGYLPLGQPSPSLSGGEAQRVKLAKYLGRNRLTGRVIVLDEPSTGLHPKDLVGLLKVLDQLVRTGATIVVVEHNTDVIRAADWVIDLGPDAGPEGGSLVYMGPFHGLLECEKSRTTQALLSEDKITPLDNETKGWEPSRYIRIRGARANNLQDVDVDIPKGKLVVVTGVSGSGKSSLVGNVLEAEARRRYLETLNLYERQGTREGAEAPVDSVSGLGVSLTVTPDRKLYNRRATVGTATEIWHHMAALYASMGERNCIECGAAMERGETWVCLKCGVTAPVASPRRFNPTTYGSACTTCHGVGSMQEPNPEKLIRDPGKPLCGGAMYSPGFFPQGYLCKPGNGGYDVLQAFSKRHGFDTAKTPWIEVPEKVRNMFLFGDPEPLDVTFFSHNGRVSNRTLVFTGFYGWIRDWDVGGTYTDTVTCPDCGGKRFRPEYLAVTLNGYNIHEANEMPLSMLRQVMSDFSIQEDHQAYYSLETVKRRLRFLNKVGLGYINLNRVTGSLSAGEAQRVKLAGLLGSGLTGLTILLDEPSRGMHPREVNALVEALRELQWEGNTVIIVEHDLEVISKADHIIDMGPGSGTQGGVIVASGSLESVKQAETVTGRWLRGGSKSHIPVTRRTPTGWLTVKGARENNLKDGAFSIPLGVLVGVCGVSGSGKSTLIIDTLGRALAPVKQTTSVAREPVDPGKYDSIEGAPARTVIVDQTKQAVKSPAAFLKISKKIVALYSESEDAKALGLDAKTLGRRCSVCHGRGQISIDMGFLPSVQVECETCSGSGYTPEAWSVEINGVTLPEVNELTLDEAYKHFSNVDSIRRPLQAARDVGLGYLVMKQPGVSLSGGEAQRLKIAKELCRKNKKGTLYILDEPTVGQHLEDVKRLMLVLHRLVDEGNTVLVVEHHSNLLAACDYIMELGPEGGPEGGYLIASGTPETLSNQSTPTAPYIDKVLEADG